MKLNNKGWGVFQMAWMTGIILFFFLLVIILIYNHYRDMGYQLIDTQIITKKSHEEMLDDLSAAATRYVEHYYPNLRDTEQIRLSTHKLFQAGLFAKDLYGDCTGYAVVKKTNGIIETSPYIKCSNYKSPGYDKN